MRSELLQQPQEHQPNKEVDHLFTIEELTNLFSNIKYPELYVCLEFGRTWLGRSIRNLPNERTYKMPWPLL